MSGGKSRKRATHDSQAFLRQLQKALAVANCIVIAIEYREDHDIDIADAVAGLLILLESATTLVRAPEGAP